MTAPAPRVAVVVLNWNGREETLACVASVLASDGPAFEVLVVDNGSEEPIEAELARRHPAVRLIRNPVNLGFAGGMNTGLRAARDEGFEFALLLNNDTLVEPAMVRELVQAATAMPDAGIVCPLVLYRDRPETILSAGLRCDLERGYQGPAVGMGETNHGQYDGVREVDAPSGAAMLVRTAVLDDVGGLDEDLFLYGEDVEWARRIQAAGRRVYVVGAAHLLHGLSTSSGGAFSPLSAYFQTRNSFVVCARHAPLRGPRRAVRGADILLANLIHARRARRPLRNARAVIAGWLDYLRGRLGPGPAWLLSGPERSTVAQRAQQDVR